jgi:hypothetical protein
VLRAAIVLLLAVSTDLHAADHAPTHTTVADLSTAVRTAAKSLEQSSSMKSGYQSFISKFKLQPGVVTLADYAVARVLFEATRDAGFWNLHWVITDKPPNSDAIWQQWRTVRTPSPQVPTAVAECDELSALYAFLVARSGIHGVGLLWPTSNHTVAAWYLKQSTGPVRIVIPTTQIFLDENDYWGTPKFDPWRQKAIYEYTRRDVSDSFVLPGPLYAFFLQQIQAYAGATDTTLQMLRYWRESVFRKSWTPQAAAAEAMRTRRNRGSDSPEDLAAIDHFVRDMQSKPVP